MDSLITIEDDMFAEFEIYGVLTKEDRLLRRKGEPEMSKKCVKGAVGEEAWGSRKRLSKKGTCPRSRGLLEGRLGEWIR